MRKFLSLLVALMMAAGCLSLAACAPSEGEDTPDVKVVKMWLHKSEAEPEGKVYTALMDMFNEAGYRTQDGRKIVVKLEFKNSADALSTAISGEVLTGGLPDIVAVDAPNIAAYADGGILAPIGEYLTDEVKSGYVDSVIEQSTYDGKLYALSGMDAPGGLYYNKELLKAAGYKDEDFGTIEKPWSWKDVSAAMKKLKDADKAYRIKLNLGFGGDEGCMYLYSPIIYSAGGAFFGENEKIEGALDSPKSLQGFKVLEDLYRDNLQNEWVYAGTNENALPGGEVAFEIYGPWHVNSIKKNYPAFKDSYGIMPFPVYEDASGNRGTVETPCGSWGFGVTPASKDKEAAARVAAFFTGKDASRLMYESIGTFPTNKELLTEIEDLKTGPEKQLADLLLQTAAPRPKIIKYPALSSAFSDIVEYIEVSVNEADYNLKNYVVSKAQHADR